MQLVSADNITNILLIYSCTSNSAGYNEIVTTYLFKTVFAKFLELCVNIQENFTSSL